jgi:hypothetical protein
VFISKEQKIGLEVISVSVYTISVSVVEVRASPSLVAP